MDIEPRREEVPTARGKPTMLQLTVQPAYASSIHKVQSLTILHTVHGCLEGIFAAGQVYVLWSRVTKPQNFHAVGLPPKDLLDDVAHAWRDAGLDVHKCFAKAVQVSDEWTYTRGVADQNECVHVAKRLLPKNQEERRVPLKMGTLLQTLNPQPQTAKVLHGLLDWIDRADLAAQHGEAPAAPLRSDGAPLFPDHEWWLTEMERRRPRDDGDESDDDEDDLNEGGNLAGGNATGSSSGWTNSDCDSDASLPAGPPLKRPKPQETKHMSGSVKASTAASSSLSLGLTTPILNSAAGQPIAPWRRRVVGKSPESALTASSKIRAASAGAQERPQPPVPAVYRGYFERQERGLCGLHALNNAISGTFFTEQDMSLACTAFLEEMRREGSRERRCDHEKPGSGFYSEAALAYVVRWKIAQHELGAYARLKLDLDNPIQECQDTQPTCQYVLNLCPTSITETRFNQKAP